MGCLWSRPEPVRRTLYEYPESLSSGHIRLLECQGSIDNWFMSMFRNRVQYKLITVELHDSLEFTAVSYMWGSSECTKTIFIGDAHELPITKSTNECLNILSDGGRLWIDSICINQKDSEEKSRQVGLMGAIYGHATKVVAILGISPKGVDPYYGTVFDGPLWLASHHAWALRRRKSLREPSFQSSHWYHEEEPLVQRLGEDMFSKFFEDDFDTWAMVRELETYSTAMRILRHPYWRRVWILQELALAKKVVVYHMGSFLPWKTLLNMAESLLVLEDHLNYCNHIQYHQQWVQGRVSGEQVTTAEFLAGYQYLVDGRTHLESIFGNQGRENYLRNLQLLGQIDRFRRMPKQAMKDILIDTVYSVSTDPRDKVFALLGLISSEPDYPTITPSYRKSLGEIYTETTLALVKAGDCSTHLLAAGIGWDPRNRGMPSWVVDWERTPQIFFDRDMHLSSTDRMGKYWAGYYNSFNRAAVEQHFTILGPDRIMSKFLLLDRIVFLSPVIRPNTTSWFMDYWDQICQLVRKDYPRIPMFPPPDMHEVLWRVLLDVPEVGRPRGHHCNGGNCVVETNAFNLGFVESNEERHLCQGLVDRAFRAWAQLEPPILPRYHELRKSFQEALSRCQSNNSCLAVTARGLLGTVPPETVIGDEVMVHLGCPMPILVRKAPDQGLDLGFRHLDRHLIGKAHFLGMMRAEWANRYQSLDEVKEVFSSKGHNVVLV
ncbi:heterokaryon incompatibility protein-domain-containing protein [Xylariaceae sp. FL0255]|nr:heterokaryon incompatibility protein-domain-containing protein [Xylariaceae sp. FL0255]